MKGGGRALLLVAATVALFAAVVVTMTAFSSASSSSSSEVELKDTHVFIHLPSREKQTAKVRRLALVVNRLRKRVEALKRVLQNPPRREVPHITVYVGAKAPPPPKKRRPAVLKKTDLEDGLERIFSDFKQKLKNTRVKQYWQPRTERPQDIFSPNNIRKEIAAVTSNKNNNNNNNNNSKKNNNSSSSSSNKKNNNNKNNNKKNKKNEKKNDACHGRQCGPLRMEGGAGSYSSHYMISGNKLEIRWKGGGKGSKITIQLLKYHSFENREVVKTLLKNGENNGKFIWEVENVPASSRYRLRIEASSPESKAKKNDDKKKKNDKNNNNNDKKKAKKQVVYSAMLTFEPSTHWGHRGRKRYWRIGGGPDGWENI